MGTNYPGAVDSFTNPAAGDALNSPSHAAQHADANDAIEAVQTELGATPSGSESTVAARLDKIEDGTRLAANSVGATQLANDSVNTAAIQSKAVTAAKIADDTITAAQIAANAVGASELADNAVDTAAIADGAATPAKLATTGRFVFPTGAANGYGFTSGAVHLSGTGTPEGVITAYPGSTWLQTDSTTDVKGWIRWVKATGTGNTGWKVGPEANTGTSPITLTNSWTGTAYLRRQGDLVTFIPGTSFNGSSYTSDHFYTLPVGFRPPDQTVLAMALKGTTVHSVRYSGNDLYVNSGTQGVWEIPLMAWFTNESWPTSLP